jgi:outer membrane protein assembly factor BamB
MVNGINHTISLEQNNRIRLLSNLAFDSSSDNGISREDYYNGYLVRDYDFENSNVIDVVELKKIDIYNYFDEPIHLPILSDGLMNSSWPMKSHDLHHTGRSPYNTADVDSLEKWRFLSGGWVDSSMVIDDDCIMYYGDKDWYLYSIYSNCTEKWRFKLNGWIWSTPAINEDGTVYCTSYDAGLYAFNPNGSLKWRFSSGGSISSSPAIADHGTVYFGAMGPGNYGRIWAVNPDCTAKWYYDTDYWIESDPAVGNDGTVYIGSGDTYFYAINPDGTLKWRFKTGDEIHGHPSIAEDGTVYIGSFDDYLYAINPDGTEKWRCDTNWGLSNSVAIGEDGTIYAGTDKVYAINPENGTKIWSFELGGQHWIGESSPAVSADGTIYIGTNLGNMGGGDIIAIKPDGTLSWRKRIATDWVESSPCIGPDGTVYIGSSQNTITGYIHAFGPVLYNVPPDTPTIDGPIEGQIGVEHTYLISSVDSNKNPISFYVNWDDDTTPGWSRDYASGETARIEHTWDEQGSYTIGVKARDTLGEESDWAYLEVTMPVNQQTEDSLFIRFLERFPNAFPLIR